MLGLCGMIVVQLTLIGLMSYWISWDMQHKGVRPVFMKQVGNDLMGLFGKLRGTVEKPGSRPVARSSARVDSPSVTARLGRQSPS
jgi:hypothetical protein